MPKSTHGMLACHLLLLIVALKAFCNNESKSNGPLGLEKGLDNVILLEWCVLFSKAFCTWKNLEERKWGKILIGVILKSSIIIFPSKNNFFVRQKAIHSKFMGMWSICGFQIKFFHLVWIPPNLILYWQEKQCMLQRASFEYVNISSKKLSYNAPLPHKASTDLNNEIIYTLKKLIG